MTQLAFSAVVLAAGNSTRMAGRHKLLLPLGEEPVIRRTVREVLGSGPEETVVVTGFNADPVGSSLAGLGVRIEFDPRATTRGRRRRSRPELQRSRRPAKR